MATNVDFEYDGKGPDGRSTQAAVGTISLADAVVNTTPNSTGGWNTATVAANLQPNIFVSQSAAITAGIKPGWYHKVGDALFRKLPKG